MNMKVLSKGIKDMAKENRFIARAILERSTMEIGSMITDTAMGFLNSRMETNIKESSFMIRDMDREHSLGLMEAAILGHG